MNRSHVLKGRLSVLGSLAVVVLGIGALVGCGSKGTSTVAPGQIIDAANRTTQGPGFKFSLDMSMSLPEHHAVVSAEGAIDEQALRGTMTMSVVGKSALAIIKSPYVYTQAPGGRLIAGKPWLRINENVYAQAAGFGATPTSDPTHMIDLLKASSSVERLGTTTIRGVQTRHYHALVNLGRYALSFEKNQRAQAQQYSALLRRVTGSETLPTDVFLDSHDRVRRAIAKLSFCMPEDNATMSMTMDIYDYGRQRVLAAPPASQVIDIADSRNQITQGLKQLNCNQK